MLYVMFIFLIKILNFILSCTLFNGHFTASKLNSSFVIYLPNIIMFQYKRHVRVSRFLILKNKKKRFLESIIHAHHSKLQQD